MWSGLLTFVTIAFAAADDSDLRISAPANPVSLAHARSFGFDPTGRQLIGVTQSGELLAWKDNAENPVVTMLREKVGDDFRQSPASVVLTNGGRDVAVFYFSGKPEVWTLGGGAKTKELESDRGGFKRAYSSPDGELVAALSSIGEGETSAIVFWRTHDWAIAGAIETPERINDFCFTADGEQVLACAGHPTDQKHLGFTGIVSWNLASKEETGRVEYGSGFPIRIAASADGRWVATGGGDAVPVGRRGGRSLSGHLRVFDWTRKPFLAELYTLPSDYVRSVQFSPDSKFLYSGAYSVSSEGGQPRAEVRAFRISDWGAAWSTKLGHGNPRELSVSPNGQDILVTDDDALRIVDAKDGTIRGAKLKFGMVMQNQDPK